METITIVMFLVVFVITILFSAFAIQLQDEIWAFLATMLWFVLGLLNIGLMYEIEPMFYEVSFLYWGLGMIFFILGWKFLFKSIAEKAQMREMELR